MINRRTSFCVRNIWSQVLFQNVLSTEPQQQKVVGSIWDESERTLCESLPGNKEELLEASAVVKLEVLRGSSLPEALGSSPVSESLTWSWFSAGGCRVFNQEKLHKHFIKADFSLVGDCRRVRCFRFRTSASVRDLNPQPQATLSDCLQIYITIHTELRTKPHQSNFTSFSCEGSAMSELTTFRLKPWQTF